VRSLLRSLYGRSRNRLRHFVRYYLGHAVGFLFCGLVWSLLYTVSLCFVPGSSPIQALQAALEISFAINPPTVVIGRFVHHHTLLAIFSALGWIVLVVWYLLIPALVAAVIQRIPGMADSLFWLMQPQVAKFIQEYSRLRASAQTTSFLIRNGDEAVPAAYFNDTAKVTLVNVVDIVNWWYCQDLRLNSNANYMEIIPGKSFHDPGAKVQFSDKAVGEHDKVLRLQAWAKHVRRVPDDFLLPFDWSRPLPGAPRCIVDNDTQFVPDTRRGLLEKPRRSIVSCSPRWVFPGERVPKFLLHAYSGFRRSETRRTHRASRSAWGVYKTG
jgi:hypothetical protein